MSGNLGLLIKLPNEILLMILSYIVDTKLSNLRRTCKDINNLIYNQDNREYIIKEFYKKYTKKH